MCTLFKNPRYFVLWSLVGIGCGNDLGSVFGLFRSEICRIEEFWIVEFDEGFEGFFGFACGVGSVFERR